MRQTDIQTDRQSQTAGKEKRIDCRTDASSLVYQTKTIGSSISLYYLLHKYITKHFPHISSKTQPNLKNYGSFVKSFEFVSDLNQPGPCSFICLEMVALQSLFKSEMMKFWKELRSRFGDISPRSTLILSMSPCHKEWRPSSKPGDTTPNIDPWLSNDLYVSS